MNLQLISSVFQNLPAQKILTLATTIQAQIPNDASLVKNKASWDQLSDGRIFTSYDQVLLCEPQGTQTRVKREFLRIDFCDFETDQSEIFLVNIRRVLPEREIMVTDRYKCAIWAGSSLSYGENQALVWIATDGQKKFYPAYDLIYLGALSAQGWCVKLGKVGTENALIVVAKTEEIAAKLWQASLSTMQKKLAEQVREVAGLQIV
jgi:hypothetical protein